MEERVTICNQLVGGSIPSIRVKAQRRGLRMKKKRFFVRIRIVKIGRRRVMLGKAVRRG